MPVETSDAHENVVASTKTEWHYGRYLAVVLLLPLLLFLLTLPLAGSRAFLRISRRSLWHAADYRFAQPPAQNCDVVIAGDSSGMIGVDPHAIEARTGWKTCNIALPYVASALAGTRVVDAYLAHNRAPRFIVFHLSNNHLKRPLLDEENGIVDGWLMVDEHFPLAERMRIFATHPLDTLRFVTAVWKQFVATQPVLRPDWSQTAYRDDEAEQKAGRGWMPEGGTTVDIVCGWQAPAFQVDRGYLDGLVARYTAGTTRAVIWTNPARDCDKRIAEYRQNAQLLGLPPTAVYDRALFFDAFHLNIEGAAQNGAAIADYLKSQPAQN